MIISISLKGENITAEMLANVLRTLSGMQDLLEEAANLPVDGGMMPTPELTIFRPE